MSDRSDSIRWARQMLSTPGALILDTETTGLTHEAEIVQIAIINTQGDVYMNSLVKPVQAIPLRAQRIHGITNEAVANAPSIADLFSGLRTILTDRTVLIYNAPFDQRLLEQSANAHRLAYQVPMFGAVYRDVMDPYSAFYGAWHEGHQGYTWQPLPGGDHSALGDCRACLALLQSMAAASE